MPDTCENTGIMSLVEGCRRNDRQSQTTLFNIMKPSMMKVCKNILKQDEDAEDCLMEGFQAMFHNIDRFYGNDERSFRTWLHTIVRNKCITRYRENKARGFATQLDESTAPVFTTNPTWRLEYDDIIKTIDGMKPHNREAFVMREIDGMGYSEIMEATGDSLTSAKTKVCRFRKELCKKLEKEGMI